MSDDDTENSGTENNVSEASVSTPSERIMGQIDNYFGEVAKHRAPEGKEVRVPYKGKVENTIQSILGGVRSACSYVGARRIKDLHKYTTFVRVTIITNEIYTSHEVS